MLTYVSDNDSEVGKLQQYTKCFNSKMSWCLKHVLFFYYEKSEAIIMEQIFVVKGGHERYTSTNNVLETRKKWQE